MNVECKMQNRQRDKLTRKENKPVEKWVDKKKVKSRLAITSSMTLAERMSKKRVKKGNKKKANSISANDDDDDDTFDHIFDTAAEVERL